MKIQIGNTKNIFELINNLPCEEFGKYMLTTDFQRLEREYHVNTSFPQKKEEIELTNEIPVESLLFEETKIAKPFSYGCLYGDIIKDSISRGFLPLTYEMLFEFRRQYLNQPRGTSVNVIVKGLRGGHEIYCLSNYGGLSVYCRKCEPRDEEWEENVFVFQKSKQSVSEQ